MHPPELSVETPVEVLITGQADTDPHTESQDIRSLRAIASQAMDIIRQSPGISVLRDDWSPDSPQMTIEIDPDRANLVGITNADVATSTAAAISAPSFRSNMLATEAIRSSLNCPNSEDGLSYSRQVLPSSFSYSSTRSGA